ncbi:MAG: VCBS repeat-containing protein [Planctomycetes bacterium]|nr:VCBS repeat-containing protein [Planctomycetota bacterium]
MKSRTSLNSPRAAAISLILIVIGVPLMTLAYQSLRSGRSWSEIIRGMSGAQSPDPLAVTNSGDDSRLPAPPRGRFRRKTVGMPFQENPYITHVQAIDLDQDGLLDVIVSDARSNRVSWIRQESPGVFSERLISPAIIAPARTQAFDIDQDGDLDVLIAGLGSLFPTNEKLGKVVILENMGDSSFTAHTIATRLPRVADVRGGDFDGDGDMDLVVSQFGAEEGRTSWMENLGDWTFKDHPLLELSGNIHTIPIDLDGDGDLDLVSLISQEWEEIYAFINDGSGNFSQHLLYGSSNDDYGSSGISLADLDGDGDTDILYTNGDAFDYTPPLPRPWHGVQWLENRGDLKFTFHRIIDYPGAYGSSPIDVDGDGDLDIVVVSSFNYWDNESAQSVIWLENNGEASFLRHNITNDPTHQITVSIGDFNNDGLPDLVTGGIHFYAPYDRIGRVTLWLNTGKDDVAKP